MSKQDFAQVKANTQAESASASGSLLSATGILVIAGLCFSAGYWLGSGDVQQAGNKTDTDAAEAKLAAQVAENRILQAKNESLQDLAIQWKKKAEQGAHTKVGELTFYKDLPKQSVTPAPVPDSPKAPPKTIAKVKPQRAIKPVKAQHVATIGKAIDPTGASIANASPPTPGLASSTAYRIQLASFRTEAGAMQMQGKLAQAGFIAQVKMADLGDKGQWFRLYAGPYYSRSSAEAAQQKIEIQMKLKGFIIHGK